MSDSSVVGSGPENPVWTMRRASRDSGAAATYLVCCACHGSLGPVADQLGCSQCGRAFPIIDGIPRFAQQDPFYADRYEWHATRFMPDERWPWSRALLYLTSMHYLWYIRRYARTDAPILDVACGGGTRYLASKAPAVGIDVAAGAVRKLDETYALGVQGSALAMPFRDATFGTVTARCFFEHVPLDEKQRLLAEIRRVLVPRGRLIMVFDTESANPLWRWARRDPELFQKVFIENDGHYGLMWPREALALLEAHGFTPLDYHAANKTPLVHLSMLQWLRAYRGTSRLVDVISGLAEQVARHRLLNFAYTFSVTVWDDLVERFLDLDRARYLVVACEKVG